MISQETCEALIRQYYKELFSYCFARLGRSKTAAEDCTQELFVLFVTKRNDLENTDNIRLWLYRAADNIIRVYWRKNNRAEISIEDCPEAQEIPSPERIDDDTGTILDELSPDERSILEAYYDTDYGQRNAAARKLGISLSALYQKVHKIKLKLKKLQ